MNSLRVLPPLLITCAVLAPFASAQAATRGWITGYVTDVQGARIVNAELQLLDMRSRKVATATTDSCGAFSFPG